MSLSIYVGYDERERVGYHVCASSILRRTSLDVAFHPVRGQKVVGSTQFNPGRFDIARRNGYRGWALWCEADMLFRADVEELLAYADPRFDVLVVPHDYRTKFATKFLGQPNPDYPRKNQSSLMLVNCMGAAWQRLAEGKREGGAYRPWTLEELHRFEFIEPGRIGALPPEWNHLILECDPNPAAKICHFTVGLPVWPEYAHCEFADEWRAEREAMLSYAGA